MVGYFLRFVYLLSGLTPMAFGVFCRDMLSPCEMIRGVTLAIGIVLLGFVALRYFFARVKRKFGVSPEMTVPEAVSRCRSMGADYVLTYIVPFVLTANTSLWVIIIAFSLIALMSFRDFALGYNPLVRLMGYSFFEVTTQRGISIFVVSDMSPQSLREGFKPVCVTEDFQIAFKEWQC